MNWVDVVKVWLELTGQTQRWLAERANTHESHFSKLIGGQLNPTYDFLHHLEKVMGLPFGTLRKESDTDRPATEAATVGARKSES